jgi:hypothetical protein
MSIKTLLLAGVLSFAAVSAVQATEGPGDPGDGTSRSHAAAAPVCDTRHRCPVLATEGGSPGTAGDTTEVPSLSSIPTGCWQADESAAAATSMRVRQLQAVENFSWQRQNRPILAIDL